MRPLLRNRQVWLLVAAMATVSASFVVATLSTRRQMSIIRASAEEMQTNAAPSVEWLVKLRGHLRAVQAALFDVATGDPAVHAVEVDQLLRACDEDLRRFLALPTYPAARELPVDLEADVRAVERDVALYLAAREADPARASLARADADLERLILFNVDQARRQANDIVTLFDRSARLEVMFDGACVLFAALATVIAIRAIRRHTRLLERGLQSEHASRMEAVALLRHADRLKTVGVLASGIAHELGTPLNVVSGHAKMIIAGETSGDETVQSARTIVEQTDRITAIVRQLLDFARRGKPELAVADLEAVVAGAAKMMAVLAQKRGVIIEIEPATADASATHIDANQIQQVLVNLIQNAIQSMPRGGRLQIAVRREQAAPPDGAVEKSCVRVVVRDEGDGIREQDLPHIFDPFFTTRGIGEGTGLGLCVAYGIVRDHDGWITVASEVGKGSEFSVFLPAREPAAVAS